MKIILKSLLAFSLIIFYSTPALANETFDSEINQYGFNQFGIKNSDLIPNELVNSINKMNRSLLSTTWDTMPSKSDVALNKEWTIKFGGSTVSLDKIAGIVIEKDGTFIPVKIKLFPAANQAIISPMEDYLSNETYTLRVFLENGLRYKMTFTTKSEKTMASSYGNTSGNIVNGGIVAESDGWIYYSNAADENRLYKMKADGTQKTKLSNNTASSINVMAGWIYYLDKNGYVYKVRTNGSDVQQISLIEYHVASTSRSILVADNGWFYRSTSDTWFDNVIYKVTYDGLERQEVVEGKTIAHTNNDVITTSKYGSLKIYNEVTKKSTILDEAKVSHINVVGDWIYYLNKVDQRIYKIKKDGTNKQQLNNHYTSSLNVYGDWIYYINDENQWIYAVKTDGTGLIQLNNTPSSEVNVINDWIYYVEPTTKNYYRMKLNGSEWQEVN